MRKTAKSHLYLSCNYFVNELTWFVFISFPISFFYTKHLTCFFFLLCTNFIGSLELLWFKPVIKGLPCFKRCTHLIMNTWHMHLRIFLFLYICVCLCIPLYLNMRTHRHTHTHTHTHTHIYIFGEAVRV